MANSFLDLTTFAGKDLDGFYTKALIKGVSKEKFRLISDVKSKVKLGSLNLSSNIIQSGACAFNAQGTATLNQKLLEVCDLMVALEFCPKDFESDYMSVKQKAGSNNSDVPTEFVDFLLELIATGISKGLEITVWQGNPDGSPIVGVCQGLLELFNADSEVIDVTGTTLSASNIVAELNKVLVAIPDAIKANPITIFLSPTALLYAKQAYAAAATAGGLFYNQTLDTIVFLGYELLAAPGMPTNVMVAADPWNLWYGTDMTDDERSIEMVDMIKTTADKFVRFRVDFKFGVNYANGSEIVYYH